MVSPTVVGQARVNGWGRPDRYEPTVDHRQHTVVAPHLCPVRCCRSCPPGVPLWYDVSHGQPIPHLCNSARTDGHRFRARIAQSSRSRCGIGAWEKSASEAGQKLGWAGWWFSRPVAGPPTPRTAGRGSRRPSKTSVTRGGPLGAVVHRRTPRGGPGPVAASRAPSHRAALSGPWWEPGPSGRSRRPETDRVHVTSGGWAAAPRTPRPRSTALRGCRLPRSCRLPWPRCGRLPGSWRAGGRRRRRSCRARAA